MTDKNGRVTDRQLSPRTWITEREPLLDEFHYVDAVSKWQPVQEPPYKGNAWALPKSVPRVTRGFVRRAAWEAHEAGLEKTRESSPSPAGTEPVPSDFESCAYRAGITYEG